MVWAIHVKTHKFDTAKWRLLQIDRWYGTYVYVTNGSRNKTIVTRDMSTVQNRQGTWGPLLDPSRILADRSYYMYIRYSLILYMHKIGNCNSLSFRIVLVDTCIVMGGFCGPSRGVKKREI